MAEGWLRALVGEQVEVLSAGIEAARVHPLARRVMKEAGVDLMGHRSQALDDYLEDLPELVITVCDGAAARCPELPGVLQLHWSFPDPDAAVGSPAEVLAEFRAVRDSIRDRIRSWVEEGMPPLLLVS